MVLLLLVETVCIVRMLTPIHKWAFEGKELEVAGEPIFFERGVIDENEPGWYIDNSLKYEDICVQSPAIDLPAGSYAITILYQSAGNGSKYRFTSKPETYRVLLGRDEMALESGGGW